MTGLGCGEQFTAAEVNSCMNDPAKEPAAIDANVPVKELSAIDANEPAKELLPIDANDLGKESPNDTHGPAKELCNDAEMMSNEAADASDDANESVSCVPMLVELNKELDSKELSPSVDFKTEEVSNNSGPHSSLESHVKYSGDVIQLKPCYDVQVREVGSCAELQPLSHVEETLNLTESEPFAIKLYNDAAMELSNDAEMMPSEAADTSDDANESVSCVPMLAELNKEFDSKELSHAVDYKTEEVSNNSGPHSSLESNVKDCVDVTQMEPCYEVQVREVGSCAELQPPSHVEETLNLTESEPFAKKLYNDAAMELSNDAEMMPSEAADTSDDANEPVSCVPMLAELNKEFDSKELSHAVDYKTEEVSNNSGPHSSLESHVKDCVDVTQLEPCYEVQVREFGSCAELQPPSHVEEALNLTESEPFAKKLYNGAKEEQCSKKLTTETPKDEVEVANDWEMETCAGNNASLPLADSNLEPSSTKSYAKEVPNGFGMELCPKGEVKEPSNDDIYSEVSDPDQSPKHVSSSLSVSSQTIDVLDKDPGGCGEVTSARCQSSFADESSRKEEHGQCKLESVSTSCVVLEIPKHIRPTGIRKITFKFRKRKEDYDVDLSAAMNPLSQEMHLSMGGSELQGSSCVPKKELMMSKKILPDNYPTTVKKLLSTGILEGVRVKYISISGEKEIPGIIKGCGYLCGCCDCNFSKVVSAYEFELHAGAKTRHPNNHIYLENGKPIYSMVQELRNAPLSMVDSVIKAMAGSSVNEEYLQAWKAKLQYGNHGPCAGSVCRSKLSEINHSTNSHPGESTPYPTLIYNVIGTPGNQQSCVEVPVEQKRLIKKPRHSVCSSVSEHKKAAEGGTKKRDNDLHKLLFRPNGLPDGTSLAYYSKGKKVLEGYKQGNGIVCSCCSTEISPSQFEAHAGWAVKRQPYRHIYTSNGLTLHDIALMLSNGQNLASSGSDDMCAACGDGGELKICKGCPRAFHAACLGLECLPTDDWYCPHCTENGGSCRKASGGSRPIILRLKRVVKAPEFEPGGCIICRSQDFSAVKFDDRTVIICDQCEKEYHVGCLRETGMCDLKELPKDKWFCSENCNKIFEALQNMAYSGPDFIPAPVSAALFEKHSMIGLNGGSYNEIQWCVLTGKSRFRDHLMLLSQAAAIFRECFDPIVAKSGRDLIPVMVYGKNISGQDFSGMYCVVLTIESVVISAALLRIFGQEVAELPLVATDRDRQGKGFFQALFSCIERLLSSLNVKHLVLPAAEEAEPMWLNKLGFRKTNHEQMLKYTTVYQLTVFKGTSLLEKDVQQ